MAASVLSDVRRVFKTEAAGGHLPVLGDRRLGSGLGQCIGAGDRVLMFETGHFAMCGRTWPAAWGST